MSNLPLLLLKKILKYGGSYGELLKNLTFFYKLLMLGIHIFITLLILKNISKGYQIFKKKSGKEKKVKANDLFYVSIKLII